MIPNRFLCCVQAGGWTSSGPKFSRLRCHSQGGLVQDLRDTNTYQRAGLQHRVRRPCRREVFFIFCYSLCFSGEWLGRCGCRGRSSSSSFSWWDCRGRMGRTMETRGTAAVICEWLVFSPGRLTCELGCFMHGCWKCIYKIYYLFYTYFNQIA